MPRPYHHFSFLSHSVLCPNCFHQLRAGIESDRQVPGCGHFVQSVPEAITVRRFMEVLSCLCQVSSRHNSLCDPACCLLKYSKCILRRMNQGPNSRDTVRKAYEYALNHIGHDKDSSEIWTDYIQLLKSGEVSDTRLVPAAIH